MHGSELQKVVVRNALLPRGGTLPGMNSLRDLSFRQNLNSLPQPLSSHASVTRSVGSERPQCACGLRSFRVLGFRVQQTVFKVPALRVPDSRVQDSRLSSVHGERDSHHGLQGFRWGPGVQASGQTRHLMYYAPAFRIQDFRCRGSRSKVSLFRVSGVQGLRILVPGLMPTLPGCGGFKIQGIGVQAFRVRVSGFRSVGGFKGSEFTVSVLRVSGLTDSAFQGFRIQGFRVQGSRSTVHTVLGFRDPGSRVQGSMLQPFRMHPRSLRVQGFRVLGSSVSGFGFQGSGLSFRVRDSGFQIQDFRVRGFRIQGGSSPFFPEKLG